MKINRNNCEAYFLDYHEGALSPEMAAEVLLFVELNPEFRIDFEGFETITLSDEFLLYDNKNSLKQTIDFSSTSIYLQNIDEFLIAEVEGLLSAQVVAEIDSFISDNPQFAQSRKLYSITKLEKDDSVVFEAKKMLHRKAIAFGSINESNFETLLAKEIEGELSSSEKSELASFMLLNPQLEKDRNLFAKTILQVDNSIVFQKKSSLKKAILIPRKAVYSMLSIAASIALLIGFYFVFNPQPAQLELSQSDNSVGGKTAQTHPIKPILSSISKPNEENSLNSAEKTVSQTMRVANSTLKSYQQEDKQNAASNTYSKINDRMSGDLAFIQSTDAGNLISTNHVDSKFIFIRLSQMYVNKNKEFYYNLKLADELQYAQYNSKDKNPEKTIFNAIAGTAENSYASLLNKPERVIAPINGWSFAELGVKTYNALTGSEVELKLRKDEEGAVMSYGIESAAMNFERETRASRLKNE